MKKEYNPKDTYLYKSNMLISAKYKSSLLENQLVAIAITRLGDIYRKSNQQKIKVKIYPAEIKDIIGHGENTYGMLKRVAKKMCGHPVVIEDGEGNFRAFSLITNADYVNRVFEITFSDEIRKHIYMDSNFTTLSLSALTGVSKNTSFRIYELLSREIFRSKKNIEDGAVRVRYNINEFRFMIGLANSEERKVADYIDKHPDNVDWDYLYNHVAIEKTYPEWRDLRRAILIPAQKELEERTDIRFEFEGIRAVGQRYVYLEFIIHHNTPSKEYLERMEERVRLIEKSSVGYKQYSLFDNNKDDEEVMEYNNGEMAHYELYDEFIDHNGLTKDNITTFLTDANGDEESVRTAIHMADNSAHIENYVGWIRSCITNGYSEPIEVVEGSKEKADVIREIKKQVTADDAVKEQVWNRIRNKEDYPRFLESTGLSEETISLVYEDIAARISLYTDWHLSHMNDL